MANFYEVNVVIDGIDSTRHINIEAINEFIDCKDGYFIIQPMNLIVEAGSLMSAMAATQAGIFGFSKPTATDEVAKEA